jgi:hypothetical protein
MEPIDEKYIPFGGAFVERQLVDTSVDADILVTQATSCPFFETACKLSYLVCLAWDPASAIKQVNNTQLAWVVMRRMSQTAGGG